MSSVDDRIVNMEFNNKQFLEGAEQSSKALEGLDRTIANAGKNNGLSTVEKGVGAVEARFSAMQVVGVTALATITSKAVSAGANLIKSLTIDPILQGFSEYQTNLNSIQTVMSNTGKSVNVVNQYMNKLNKYSDQTIYNFSEMAKNIGTFTAAGVDLKTATSSIQGIANLAALSGSNSEQASRAMYQLSQAIASGRVSLQDWNSVVNAGMGGKIFQNALAQTSVAMGELDAKAIGFDKTMGGLKINGESFRQSISAAGGASSWLTSGALVTTLATLDGRFSTMAMSLRGINTQQEINAELQKQRNKLAKQGVKFSDEEFKKLVKNANAAYEAATVVKTFPQLMQVTRESIGSIFANSFGILLGNFNQSKRLWTKISSVITGPGGIIPKMGASITGMLKNFVDFKGFDGRTKIVQGFFRIGRTIQQVFWAISGAFNDVFGSDGLSVLEKITLGWKELTKIIRVHHDTAKNLRDILGGVFSVIHIGWTILTGVLGAFKAFFSGMSEGADDAQHGILGMLAGVGNAIKAFDKWISSGDRVKHMMADFGKSAGKFVGPLVHAIGLVLDAFGALAHGDTGGFVAMFNDAKSAITDFASNVAGGLSKVTSPIQSVSDFFQRLKDKIDSVRDSFTAAEEPVNKINDTFSKFSSSDSGGSFGFGGMSGGSALGLEKVAQQLDATGKSADGTKTSVDSMWEAFTSGNADKALDYSIKSADGAEENQTMWQSFTNSMVTLAKGLNAAFQHVADAISWVFKKFNELTTGMDLLDWVSVINAIIAGGLMLTFREFAHDFSGIFESLTDTLRSAQNGIRVQMILGIALAITALAVALAILTMLDPAKMGIAVGAIGALLGMITAMMFAMEHLGTNVKLTTRNLEGNVPTFNANLIALAAAMLIISFAMLNLATAVAIFGNMDMGTLAKGFGAMALTLALLLGTMFLFSKIKGSIEGMAASIFVISLAMNMLAAAVLAFGLMDPGTLGKGLGAMAIGLGLLVLAMRAMDKMKGSPEGLAASIFVLATSMVVMAGAVAAFGNMSLKTLAIGMGSVALMLALMVGALFLLSKNAPGTLIAAQSILMISAAMVGLAYAVGMLGAMDGGTLAKGFIALAAGLTLIIIAAAAAMFVIPGLYALGAALALVGLGMLAFGVGFALMAAAGTAGLAIIMAGFEAFMALLPIFAVQFAAAIVSFIEVLAEASPRLREAFDKILDNMMGVIIDNVPRMAEMFLTMLHAAYRVIREAVPDFVETGLTLIDSFLASMASHVPHIVDNAGDLIINFIRALDKKQQEIIDAGTDLVIHFLLGLGKNSQRISFATGQMILDILEGIDAAVIVYAPQIRDAGISIAGHLLEGLTGGISSKIGSVASGISGTISSHLPHFGFGHRLSAPTKEKKLFAGQTTAVKSALTMANAIQLEGIKARNVVAAAVKADNKARAAAGADALAQLADKRVKEAQKYAKKHKGEKGAQARIDKLQKAADKAGATAEVKRKAADAAASAFDSAKEFEQADNLGKADIKSKKAVELADRANAMLGRAQAEAKEAAELRKKDKKAAQELMKQAKIDADAARSIAADAQQANKDANVYYKKELDDRLNALDAEAKAQQQQAEYDAADDAGKAKIMQKRAEEDQIKADAAKKQADDLVKQAKALATTDPKKALELLDKAEEQAKIAQEAADKAKQEKEQVEQLTGTGGSTPGSGDGGSIQPSRSAMEDAANAVDRYTKSLNQAEYLAAATPAATNYTQIINSPSPLDPLTVHRHTKSALAVQEVKLGGTPVINPGTG